MLVDFDVREWQEKDLGFMVWYFGQKGWIKVNIS